MVRAKSFGAYTLELDRDEIQILDRRGQMIAAFNPATETATKIVLPDGQQLDVMRLIAALKDEGATSHHAIGVLGSGLSEITTIGSGMFFANGVELDGIGHEDAWAHGGHGHFTQLLAGLTAIGTLAGFQELQVLQNDPEQKGQAPSLPLAMGEQTVTTNLTSGSNPPGGSGGIVTDPHAPIASNESLTLVQDASISRTVTGTDPDGDPLTYSVAHGPHHGTLIFNADGTFTYTPNAGYHGVDSFTYQANDGGHHSNNGHVSLLVTPANQAPIIAVDEALTVAQDHSLAGSVIASDLNGDHLTYRVDTGPSHGTVSVNADGTFTYTPNAGYHGADHFTFKANDGSVDSNAGTVTLLVTPGNEAPIASDENIAAPENTTLQGSVTATDANADHLSYSLISGPSHGSLIFHADGSFTYVPSANYHGNDSFTYKANDGSLDSNTGTVLLTLTSVNQAPVAADENLVTGESTQLHGTVTATDYNGDTLSYTLINGPQHGTVSIAADGRFVYTPNAGYFGTDSFTYRASDGSLNSNAGLVSLIVTPANHAPVASDESLTIAEDGVLAGGVTAADANGDHLTYALVSGPSHGAVSFNGDGTFIYTPTADYHGADSFTFKANDGSLDSNIGTVSLLVTPINHAPLAHNQAVTLAEDSNASGAVVATDLNGDPLTYSLVSGPAHGALTFNSDGSFTYTPSANYNGADSFTYKANDGSLDSNVSTVSLTVTPVNDAPVSTAASLTTAEDTLVSGSVTATDVDGDHLSYSVVAGPAHGTLVFNNDGTFTYTPAANYNGVDSFTYKANDGSLGSNVSAVSLTVTAVDDAPVTTPISLTTAEDTALVSTVTASDVEGDPLTYSLVSGPAHGSLVFNSDGSFTYTPDADYNGSDSFSYKANDGSLDSNVSSVILSVTPVNDAPVSAAASLTTAEDTLVSGSVTATDVDGDHLSYSVVAGPAHGTLVFNNDGTFTYTPAANYNGSDSFTYKANDGSLDSNVSTVTLSITPVNDAPVAAAATASLAEDTVLTGSVTASDVEGDTLSYRLGTGPAHGSLVFHADGTYSYTPVANYNGSDSFTFIANDGQADSAAATVNLTVTPVNDAPVANNASVSTNEDTVLTGSVTANDVDGDTLSYSLVSGPAHGALTLNADGSYSYTPSTDYNGSDSFVFKASDGSLTSNGTVNLTVNAVNDAPVVTADALPGSAISHINQLSTTYNPLGATTVGDYIRLAQSKVINNPTLVNGIDPASIVLTQAANVTATYVMTKGGYASMIGTYVVDASGHIDPTSVKFLWLNATSVTKNLDGSPLVKDFLGNTQPLTINLGPLPAGSHLGTFMVSNGANQSANTTLLKALAGVDKTGDNYTSDLAAINAKTSIVFDGAGVGHIAVNGTQLTGQSYFTTNPSWNGDYATHGVQHMIAGIASNNDRQLYIGLEDDFFDKNYDDNGMKYDIGDYNLAKITQPTFQPAIALSDVDSTTLTAATIDTHGFGLTDSLHIPTSALFDVTATKSGNDYHIAIAAHAGTESIANFQAFLNTIFFTSSGNAEGNRTMDYTVTDDQHATSVVAHGTVNVLSSYDVSASMLTSTQTMLGGGDDHLRLDAALTHNVDLGAGTNLVGVERNNASFTHSDAQFLQDVQHLDTTAFGTNNVTLNIADVLHITDGGHHLTVTGDAADSVTLNNDGSGHHWQLTGAHDGLNVYTWNDPAHAAVVEISQLMHQTAN